MIRAGSFKLYTLSTANKEYIRDFHFAGELMGFNGTPSAQHQYFAQALEVSSICVIDYPKLLALTAQLPQLQYKFIHLLNQRDEHTIPLNSSASERVALFLLAMSTKFKRRGYSPTRIPLRMSRQDIANYLGLAAETMSRVMTLFTKKGVIKTDREGIYVQNLTALKEMAGDLG